MNLDFMSSAWTRSKIFAFSAFSIGRLGVPFFLMISGYLLLDREYNNEKCKRFWKNNWLHLLICTEIWWVIYDIFLYFKQGQAISIKRLLEEILFIRKVNMSHVWYMPMILGMYLLLPIAANAIKTVDLKVLQLPLILFTCYSFGYPFIHVINNALGGDALSLQISLGFSGGTYGIYIILGYLVKKDFFKGIRTSMLVALSLFSYVGVVLFQVIIYSLGYAYNVWYDCPLLLICTWSIFELFSRVKKIPFYGIAGFLSYYSFGVYLIHDMVRRIIISHLASADLKRMVKVIIVWAVTTVVSFMAGWFINRIPKVGKYVLYTK